MTSKAFSALALGIGVSAPLTMATASFLIPANIPRSSVIIYFFYRICVARYPAPVYPQRGFAQLSKAKSEPVIIYGAGQQGIALVQALSNSNQFRPFAFIDDDPKKQKSSIHGLKVHSPLNLSDLLEQQACQKKSFWLWGRTSIQQRKLLIEKLAEKNPWKY